MEVDPAFSNLVIDSESVSEAEGGEQEGTKNEETKEDKATAGALIH